MRTPASDQPLTEIADRALERAAENQHGRHAELLVHDGPLRQTLIALTRGSSLADHNAPPAASLQVLVGALQVTTEEEAEDVPTGALRQLPGVRHGVHAPTDTVFLLTTVTSVPGESAHR